MIKAFLIFFILASSLSCKAEPRPPKGPYPWTVAEGVQQIGFISDPLLKEDSGVVASRSVTNLFWTHTDGAKVPFLFAIDRTGKTLAQFYLNGVHLHDWEDIAADNAGNIYVGDIGNNDAGRNELYVLQVKEPSLDADSRSLTPLQKWTLHFPAKPFDCESLFVYADYGYVASKLFDKSKSVLYRFPLAPNTNAIVLEKVCSLPIVSPVTGADISVDGKQVAFVAHSGAYVFDLNGDMKSLSKAPFVHIPFKHQHVEGCTFVPDGLLATSENREVFLFTYKGFKAAR
ncbi:MAG: hypothetical protein JWN25_479 [Verrucomicrobiales bacterium]|nr:hypothetical protein [Verrucomicrobiales bacterium]